MDDLQLDIYDEIKRLVGKCDMHSYINISNLKQIRRSPKTENLYYWYTSGVCVPHEYYYQLFHIIRKFR